MLLLPEQPFEWNEEVYKSHIESVCRILGEYEGNGITIFRSSNLTTDEWNFVHDENKNIPRGGYFYTSQELSVVIDHFVFLLPCPDLSP